MGLEPNGSALARRLIEINEYETALGRPMLSAVVVNNTTKMPGQGFFKHAIRQGATVDLENDDSKRKFWKKELGRVHRQW